MEYSLQKPADKDFDAIYGFIKEFELDNRDLKKEQFVVALSGDEIFGFGRLRKHQDCIELCSLGVVTPHRMQGIGKAIVEELIKNSKEPVFLVCIIPDFFGPFGFHITKNYPASIQDKMNYCTSELVMPETYVAMVFSGK